MPSTTSTILPFVQVWCFHSYWTCPPPTGGVKKIIYTGINEIIDWWVFVYFLICMCVFTFSTIVLCDGGLQLYCMSLIKRITTRSTQKAQTSLAEADHYSHIAHCKNVKPWLWKTTHPPKKKGSGSLPAPRSGYATTSMVFFYHLLILQYPDHHQNLISSSLYYSGPVHKISPQSVHKCFSNVVHRQTDRQTNQHYQKHNLLCQGGNYKCNTVCDGFYYFFFLSLLFLLSRYF